MLCKHVITFQPALEDLFAFGSNVEMWPPVTYTEGIPDRKHSGYIQYTYRGLTCMHHPPAGVHQASPCNRRNLVASPNVTALLYSSSVGVEDRKGHKSRKPATPGFGRRQKGKGALCSPGLVAGSPPEVPSVRSERARPGGKRATAAEEVRCGCGGLASRRSSPRLGRRRNPKGGFPRSCGQDLLLYVPYRAGNVTGWVWLALSALCRRVLFGDEPVHF